MKRLSDYVVFHDKNLQRKYANAPIPMATLYEAYFDGDLDIPGTSTRSCDDRNRVREVLDSPPKHLKWAVTNFIPEVAIHSQAAGRAHRPRALRPRQRLLRLVPRRAHGLHVRLLPATANETLEQAQDNKLDLVCQKLQLKPGERLLDIGCGWGTLVAPRGQALRRRRDRRHDRQEPDRVRQRADRRAGRARTARASCARTTATSRRRSSTRSRASRWSSTSA